MQLVSLYPFDPTGRASANRIENQSLTITPPTSVTDYSYAVPRGAPFYAESLVVKDGRSTGARTLVENVDYWCVIDFLSASVSLNKRISVGIALLDPGYSGTLYVTYQAVGGNYSLADYSILEELIRERYVVKHVSYEQIINLPEGFAPAWHEHQVADMVGMSQVVSTMTGIKTAIGGREGSYGQLSAQISNHTGSSAAHTPAQIGLGNVKNYDVATIAEATSGAGNKYIVASIMKQYVQQMQPVLTGFITTVNANLAFATKAQLNSYLTSTQSDSKYAFKSDSYTKSQVDALVNGIDVSSSLGGYYTKVQSDAKYATVASIADYIKTTVADGRYATKLEMSGVYTKTQTDDKYPLKTASYTKGESDSRYLLSSALTGYLTQSAGDARYQSKSDMSNYISVNDARYGRTTSIAFSNIANGKRLTISDANPSGARSWTADLDLSDYAKTTGNVTRDDVVKMYVYLLQQRLQLQQLRATTVVTGYYSNKLSTQWVLVACRMTRSIKINAYVVTPFYFDENSIFRLTLAAGKALPNTGSNVVNLEYMGFNSDLRAYHHQQDTWVRPTSAYATLDKAAGTLTIPMMFSWAAENKSSYVSGLVTTVELVAPTDTDFHSIISLMQAVGTVTVSDLTTPPFGADLRAHMGW